MDGHRILSPQQAHGPPADLIVEERIKVNEVALGGVSAPDPAVPLDPIQEKFPGAQVKGAHGGLIDPV